LIVPSRSGRAAADWPSVTCCISQVGEPDEPWNFDSLLNDISQELQKDVDEKEEFLRAEAAAAAT
jgi:hypothetical protein